MCPILEGVDLSSVSTDFETYPEQEYVLTILSSTFSDDTKKQLVIKQRIEEPAEFAGKPYSDFINLVKNNGTSNEIGWKNVKRYMEAVFGKGSDEAEAVPPDTDQLNGHRVRSVLEINSYQDKNWKEGDPIDRKMKKNNKVKGVFAA